MHKSVGGMVALALATVAVTAQAQRKVDNIGNAGGIVVGAERLVGGYHSTTNEEVKVSQTIGGSTVTQEIETETSLTTYAVLGNDPAAPTLVPRIALDYFPIDGLSLGGAFVYLRLSGEVEGERRITAGGMTQTDDIDAKAPTQSILAIHPRIGYAAAFNEFVGIWPRVGFSYIHFKRVQEITDIDPNTGLEQKFDRTTTVTLTHLTLEGLLFVSPFTGFAFVGGPFADIGLGGKTEIESEEPGVPDEDGDAKNTTIGFIVGVAGYFDTQ